VVVADLAVELVVDPAEDPTGVTRTTVTDVMVVRLPLGRALILVTVDVERLADASSVV